MSALEVSLRQSSSDSRGPARVQSHAAGLVLGRYKLGAELGCGTYGTVRRGTDVATGGEVAVKVFKQQPGDTANGVPCSALREIAALHQLRHPNITSLLEVGRHNGRLVFVTDLAVMDLKRYISNQRASRTNLRPATLQSFTQQMLRGLRHVHRKMLLHRDVKPDNVLLYADGAVKLADFGLQRSTEVPLLRLTHEVVTLWYRPPEILLGASLYDSAVDVWSVACVAAELQRLSPLFESRDGTEVSQLMTILQTLGTPEEGTWRGVDDLMFYQKSFPKWKGRPLSEVLRPRYQQASPNRDFVSLLQSLLAYDPRKRRSAAQALRSVYFAALSPMLPVATVLGQPY